MPNSQSIGQLGSADGASIRVLIAQEDAVLAAGIAAILSAIPEFEIVVHEQPCSATSTCDCSRGVAIAITDYDEGLRLVQTRAPRPSVIIFTPENREVQIRAALEKGVRGYLLAGCGKMEIIDAVRALSRGGTAFSSVIQMRLAESLTHQCLTARELVVIEAMALGLSNKGIARYLSLAEGTVKSHVKSILDKLDARGRTEAVTIAQRRGLLPEPSGHRRAVAGMSPQTPTLSSSPPAT
jgi:DNA-binding NarL/FixJ family response regulator